MIEPSGQGVALIAVDGKPAKAFAVGARLDNDLVLQAVSLRTASIGPAQGAASVKLEIPPLPAPATGTLPSGAVAPSINAPPPIIGPAPIPAMRDPPLMAAPPPMQQAVPAPLPIAPNASAAKRDFGNANR